MKSYIQKLSPISEFFLVSFVLFGFFIFNSSASLYCSVACRQKATFTDTGVAGVLFFEVFALLFVMALLAMRGYSKKDIAVKIDFKSTCYGFWLLIKYYIISFSILFVPLALISILFYDLAPHFRNPAFRVDLSYSAILGIALINPVFEELALMGYLFTSIEKVKSTTTAMYLSLAVRLSYHLYQGSGILLVAVFGYLIGKAYIRKRNIWPLIVCHACVDLISLIANKLAF
jgi:membrane protease YdiL (CAAX protease family)